MNRLALYKHQEQAIALASQGEGYVATTGTGSGKSLCFFIPIVDTVLRERPGGGAKQTRAIVICPMDALANSQMEELKRGGDERTDVVQKYGAEPPEGTLSVWRRRVRWD
ncbi:MAG: hypothetical protein A3H97_06435 [Acidobacteria bacterium RIFCSPLOWO2_02_FULL_65_29]|nr:MAG: hypothetical protein A3H97_06435 [Acidobacteria bacterium RIFCSPLOWO2_02_FULL_65_29]